MVNQSEPGSAGPGKDASAVSSARPKLAVFLPIFGIPSEIWAVRQCVGMRAFDPVVIAWEKHPAAPADQFGLDVRYLDLPWTSERSLWQRVSRRLGVASASIDVEEGRRIASVLREVEPAAILCHFLWTGVRVTNALAGSSATEAEPVPKSTPIIWHAHGRDVSKSLTEQSFRSSVVRAMVDAAGVVAVGSHQLKRLGALGLPPEKGRLIPCGVPMADFGVEPMPRRTTRGIRFITIGRVSPEKGALHTIHAFAAVRSVWEDAELVVVGDGPDLAAAKSLAAALGVSSAVRFTGFLDSPEVKAECSAAHAFVQHSREIDGWVEGFGVSVAEAMAAGLAPVVSASGGILDQVQHNVNGFLFPPQDHGAQARAMLALAEDESLRLRLAEAARDSARRYDTIGQVEALETFIRHCLNPVHG
ncbi:MAG: glycosyltransferase family 4 protein [Pirellulaceae bacterium]